MANSSAEIPVLFHLGSNITMRLGALILFILSACASKNPAKEIPFQSGYLNQDCLKRAVSSLPNVGFISQNNMKYDYWGKDEKEMRYTNYRIYGEADAYNGAVLVTAYTNGHYKVSIKSECGKACDNITSQISEKVQSQCAIPDSYQPPQR